MKSGVKVTKHLNGTLSFYHISLFEGHPPVRALIPVKRFGCPIGFVHIVESALNIINNCTRFFALLRGVWSDVKPFTI